MMENLLNWKEMIEDEMKNHNDSFHNVISCTLSEDELLEKFNTDYGSTNGKHFTLWTKTRVYFPVVYDGAEWVGSVSRNPDGNQTKHIGGGYD